MDSKNYPHLKKIISIFEKEKFTKLLSITCLEGFSVLQKDVNSFHGLKNYPHLQKLISIFEKEKFTKLLSVTCLEGFSILIRYLQRGSGKTRV